MMFVMLRNAEGASTGATEDADNDKTCDADNKFYRKDVG